MTLQDAAVRTFRDRAIRSAVLIDDQFPKYDQAVAGDSGRFGEADRAAALHRGFHGRRIPCDVENDPGLDEGDGLGVPDRIRKCDLVVLDYHLEGEDSSKSVRLLRALADTDHFNLVVVYTQETDLAGVWLTMATNLRGGVVTPEEAIRAALNAPGREHLVDEADEEWAEVSKPVPEVPRDLIRAYVGDRGVVFKDRRREFCEELRERDFPPHVTGALADAALHRGLGDLQVEGTGHEKVRETTGRCGTGGPFWLLSKNLFVVVMKKMDREGNRDEVDYICEGLGRAIRDWNPNPFQVIASEAQNILELEALTLGERALLDDDLHVGMALSALVPGASIEDAADGILRRLGETLSARVRRRLEEKLETDDGTGVAGLIRTAKSAIGDDGAVLHRARLLAHAVGKTDEVDVLKRLNAYLCSHPVDMRHLTAGSVFRSKSGTYWLCTTPACDMVPRGPRSTPDGTDDHVHPGKPFRAVRLTKVDNPYGVLIDEERRGAKVEQGRHVFVEVDGDILVFLTVDSTTGQPFIEAFVADEEGRLDDAGRFSAVEVTRNGATFAINESSFEVIGRLRDAYADRFLGVTGHHLSRVGVDFIGRGRGTDA